MESPPPKQPCSKETSTHEHDNSNKETQGCKISTERKKPGLSMELHELEKRP